MSRPRAGPPRTRVAVGVLVRGDGAVLLGRRPPGKPYAGYWEFPGGKIEDGETVEQALARELREELDLRIAPSLPWVVTEYDYPHARVRLYFQRVFAWSGAPRPLEGQRLCFAMPADAAPSPLLPAAEAPWRWLGLPALCAFSPGTARDAAAALAWLEDALARGLRLVLWHEPVLDEAQAADALQACAARARAFGAIFVAEPEAAGAGRLLSCEALQQATVRPAAEWLGARVRDRADLLKAAALGCDFAVAAEPCAAGGVAPRELCRDSPVPLYVARPPSAANLERCRREGAHGIALLDLPQR